MFGMRKRTLHCFLQLILVSLFSVAFANDLEINIRLKEKDVLDKLLAEERYDPRIRPSGVNETDDPVVIRVNIYARNIPIVNDDKQEISVQLTFRQQWVDERLKFDNMGGKLKYLSLASSERIWMPDSFFSNEKESHSHNMLMPNVFVRIFPTGVVYYSTRISLTLDCPMNFQRYPFDRQDCSIRIFSYAYFSDNVVFLWKEGDPVQVSNRRDLQELQGFTLTSFSSGYCSMMTVSPEYSCLNAIFSFKRDLMPSLIQIYIPSCILVLSSFVSFWLDPDSVAARVFLCATTLLAMIFQISNAAASVPTVSYIKAVDIWMGVCLIFIFGTLLEFATLNYISRHNDKNKSEEVDEDSLLVNDEGKDSMKTWTSRYKNFHTWLLKFSRSRKIDVVSRIMFPVAFVIFNLAYWITYLKQSDS